MRSLFLVPLAFVIAAPAVASGQQKVAISRSAGPEVSLRIGGAFPSLRNSACPHDSVELTGAVGEGSRLEGGPNTFTGPVTGMKFFIQATSDAGLAGTRLELKVPSADNVLLHFTLDFDSQAKLDMQGERFEYGKCELWPQSNGTTSLAYRTWDHG